MRLVEKVFIVLAPELERAVHDDVGRFSKSREARMGEAAMSVQ